MELNSNINSLVEMDAENNLTEASTQKLTLKRKQLRNTIYHWIRKAKINETLPTKDELFSVSDQLFDIDRLLVDIDSVDQLNKCSVWDGKIQFLRDVIEKGHIPVELAPVGKPVTAATVAQVPVTSQVAQVQVSSVFAQNLSENVPGEVILPSLNYYEAQKKLWYSYKGDHVYHCELCKIDLKDPHTRKHFESKRHLKNIKALETGIPKKAQKFLDMYPFLKFQGNRFFCTVCGTYMASTRNLSAQRHFKSDTHQNGKKAKEAHYKWLENVSRDEVTTEFYNIFAARGISLNVFKNQAFIDFLTKVTGRVLFNEATMRWRRGEKSGRTAGDSDDNGSNTAKKRPKPESKAQNGKGPKRSKKRKLETVQTEFQPEMPALKGEESEDYD